MRHSFSKLHTMEMHAGTDINFLLTETLDKQAEGCTETGQRRHQEAKRRSMTKSFACPDGCGRIYSSQSSATEHTNSTHRGRRFPCPDGCGENFAQKCSALSHAESVHRGIRKKSFCPEGCGKAFPTKSKASWHARVAHHNHRVPCPKGCGKTFTEKYTAKFHVRSVHDKSEVPCPNGCSMASASLSNARTHSTQQHGEGNRIFPRTRGCNKTFTLKGNAGRHENLCHQDKITKYICILPLCINTLKRQPLSRMHGPTHAKAQKSKASEKLR
jgi:hypothetical protein